MFAAFAAIGVIAMLAGLYAWGMMQVSGAEDVLADEQARTAQLRSDEAALIAYAQLQQRRELADESLITVLGDEVSLAAILQDVSLALPEDTQLDSLSITLTDPVQDVRTVGSFTASATGLRSHAPGVERALLAFDQLATFRELYVNSSTLETNDERVVTFSFDGQISSDVLTHRYRDGLPEAEG